MISLTPLRLLLLGVMAVGLGSVPLAAQQSKKAQPKAATGESRPTRPPVRDKDRDVEPTAGQSDAPRRPRPPTQELKIEPLPPSLEKLLKDWELESAKVKTLVGKHQRIVYNKVFEVEKWAEGEFFYEAPDKGRIDLKGIPIKKTDKSRKISETSGSAYKLEADQPTRWICTGKEILNINDEEKTFEAYPLPKELHGTNIIHGPLPFLFGMKAEEAKRRFVIKYEAENDPKKNNDDFVIIQAKPRQLADKENFQFASIKLDKKRFLPLAVKLLDPSGNLETVYVFPEKSLHVNQRSLIPEVFRDDPFQPKLKGYKMMQQPVASQDEKVPAQRERTGGSPVRQTSGTGEAVGNGQSPKAKPAATSPSSKKSAAAPKTGK